MKKRVSDEDLKTLVEFQEIDQYILDRLEQINACYQKNGLLMTVARAYFYGLVMGKRTERAKRKREMKTAA